jgi:DNA-binding NarL/FixJ family response regulator
MASVAAFSKRVRVGLIDDHPLFRQGLAAVLTRDSNIDVVGEASNAEEAIELARHTPLDVAVVDILMPSVSGISLTSELFELQPSCRVLALSVIDEPCIIADMLRARACGYALKTQPIAQIVEAIGQVLGGLRYLPPHVSADEVEAQLAGTPTHPFSRLTRREREVFELLIRGHTNEQIAGRLFIARRTVETHRQRVMNKLSAHSVAQMQRLAARHGGLGH